MYPFLVTMILFWCR